MPPLDTSIPDLGPLEFRLLRILWRSSPASAKDVLNEYNRGNSKKLKYTTVMTLLSRLTEKGVLAVDRERQPFHFSPLIGRDELVRQRLTEFVELFFDGRPGDLALRLVEDTDLSEDSIGRLETLLRRQKGDEA